MWITGSATADPFPAFWPPVTTLVLIMCIKSIFLTSLHPLPNTWRLLIDCGLAFTSLFIMTIPAALLSTSVFYSKATLVTASTTILASGIGMGSNEILQSTPPNLAQLRDSIGGALGVIMAHTLARATFASKISLFINETIRYSLVDSVPRALGVDHKYNLTSAEIDMLTEAYNFGLTRTFLMSAVIGGFAILILVLLVWYRNVATNVHEVNPESFELVSRDGATDNGSDDGIIDSLGH